MNWNIKYKPTSTEPEKRLFEIKNRLFLHRNLTSPEEQTDFLNPPFPSLESLLSSIKDLDQEALLKASTRLKEAIKNKEPILIYGDYDCDGVCSTAILWRVLFDLGAIVYPFIPHRIDHGYGLSQKGITDALNYLSSKVKISTPVIVTVDNGITATEVASELKSQGIDLIITDHHTPPSSLPDAHSIVHTTSLSGSGVAWLLASSLTDNPKSLGLAALGTVCDLLPLVGPNRQIVTHGLKELRYTTNPGLTALYNASGITDPNKLSTYHLGYLLGPRINAVGRLGHALDALRLLCTNKTVMSENLAKLLSDHNLNRQDLTSKYSQEAIEHFKSQKELPNLLFIANPEYHEGIIGLIASRLTEYFHRPSIVISLGEGLAKASARSVDSINITKHISLAKDHLLGFGGHPGAAGFSFEPDKLTHIQTLLQNEASKFDSSLFNRSLQIEIDLSPEDLSFNLLQLVEEFAPFGVSNPSPLFSTILPIQSARLVGKKNEHLKVSINPPYQHLDVIGFGLGSKSTNLKDNAQMAFSIDRNTFNGKTSLQLLLKDLKD